MNVDIGTRVTVRGDPGVVRFVGRTTFSTGQWVGIELDEPKGKNNGSVQGVQYFECLNDRNNGNHGLFVRPGLVKVDNRLREPSPIPVRSVSRPASSMVMGPPPNLRPSANIVQRPSSEMDDRPLVVQKQRARKQPSIPQLSRQPQPQQQQQQQQHEAPPSSSNRVLTGDSSGNLTRQIETLKSKLKIMEKKRLEDRERTQTDTKKVAKLENIVRRLQVKLTPMHEETQSLREKIRTLESENAQMTTSTTTNDDALEMATLDREMAEERAETLQMELDSLRQKFEDIELECEILKEENALYADGSKGDSGDQGTILRLEKRNEKLEAALIKLREVYNTQEESYKSKISELEHDAQEAGNVTTSYQQASDQLKHAEEVITDLRQQLDDALGAEDMIESLTEKNLELSEKITQLQTTIEELETLKELNDELEMNNTLREKELMEELESLQTLNNKSKSKISDYEERNAYLESAIVKFRDLVATLDSELQGLKASESSAARNQAKEIANLDLSFSSTSMAKTLELEMRKFDSEQIVNHLNIVKCYLPDDYKGEEPSIEVLLRLEKIAFQAGLIVGYMRELLNSDNATLIGKICMGLLDTKWLATGLVKLIKYSSSEQFVAFGSLNELVSPIESSYNDALALLQKKELRESEFLKTVNAQWLRLRRVDDDYSFSPNCEHLLDEIVDLCDFSVSMLKTLKGTAVDHLNQDLGVVSRTKVIARNLGAEFRDWNSQAPYNLRDEDLKNLQAVKQTARSIVSYLVAVSSKLDEDSSDLDSCLAHLNGENPASYAEKLTDIKSVILNELISVTVPETPWSLRAQQIKELKQQDDVKDQQIVSLKEREQKLVASLRGRDKSIEELEVKINLANSKLAKSKDQDKVISDLKRNLNESLDQEKKLKQDIEQLRKDFESQAHKEKAAKKIINDNLQDASISTLKSQVRNLRLALEHSSNRHQKRDIEWLKQPMEPSKGRVRSQLQISCQTLFRDIRDAVDKFELITITRQPRAGVQTKRQLLHHLAQIEGLENIKLQIMHLVT